MYSTGEIAKLCGVSVRTVQYYDERQILVPSDTSEGGRRLYTEDDAIKLKTICFLREIGLSINVISKILKEENSPKVIATILREQQIRLTRELDEKKENLQNLQTLLEAFEKSNETKIEKIIKEREKMQDKKSLRKIRRNILLVGLGIDVLEVSTICIWIFAGIWIPFVIAVPIIVVAGVLLSKYYYNSVKYICPECNTVFKPAFKQAFWANHTPNTRKLTCPCCKKKSFCVEVADC